MAFVFNVDVVELWPDAVAASKNSHNLGDSNSNSCRDNKDDNALPLSTPSPAAVQVCFPHALCIKHGVPDQPHFKVVETSRFPVSLPWRQTAADSLDIFVACGGGCIEVEDLNGTVFSAKPYHAIVVAPGVVRQLRFVAPPPPPPSTTTTQSLKRTSSMSGMMASSFSTSRVKIDPPPPPQPHQTVLLSVKLPGRDVASTSNGPFGEKPIVVVPLVLEAAVAVQSAITTTSTLQLPARYVLQVGPTFRIELVDVPPVQPARQQNPAAGEQLRLGVNSGSLFIDVPLHVPETSGDTFAFVASGDGSLLIGQEGSDGGKKQESAVRRNDRIVVTSAGNVSAAAGSVEQAQLQPSTRIRFSRAEGSSGALVVVVRTLSA